ncbi:hypothetical protein OG749_45280 [Streptomyces nojiriensis]|uniref:hypothetical protein n=1 Tax=Streptomyces nojiriensis TaxID=66374 RepID=UPI002E16B9B1
MDQDDDGLAAEAAPYPRPGGSAAQPPARRHPHAATRTPPRAQPPEQITSREGGDRGEDDSHHDHRIPIADNCSIRSDVSVAALLR